MGIESGKFLQHIAEVLHALHLQVPHPGLHCHGICNSPVILNDQNTIHMLTTRHDGTIFSAE